MSDAPTTPAASAAAIPAIAAAPMTPSLRPPDAVVALHESHHRNIVRAFMKQRSRPYLIGVGVKFAVRLALLFGPSQLLPISAGTSSLITLAVMLWILWDLFRAPLARATHKAQLPFSVNGKVMAFLVQRSKAHAPATGVALEEALIDDLCPPASTTSIVSPDTTR